jgi:FkbM family methyltransferase
MGKHEEHFNRRATLDDVWAAYRLFLKRSPDPNGLSDYGDAISKGLSIDDLASSFLESEEFNTLVSTGSRLHEVEIDGRVLFARANDPNIGSVILRDRQYEPHVTAVIKDLVQSGQTFVDIGANIGFFTSLAARLVGHVGKVIAVEANPENVQILFACLIRNGFTNVKVLPFAASDEQSIHSLEIGGSNATVAAPRDPSASTQYVQSVILDRQLANEGRIDVVKIDIEGFEVRAFRGFRDLLRKFRPTVVGEFHPIALREIGDSEPEEYINELARIHTDFYVITMDKGPVRCTGFAEIMDHWRAVNSSLGTGGDVHVDLLATSQ